MCEVKIAGVWHRLNEHPIPAWVITWRLSLLMPVKMKAAVFGGCDLWAMACWKNTRSVCRICQINFNSGRIWAVNTQEIAGLVWAWSVIQEVGGGGCLENWIVASNLKCGCLSRRGWDGNSPVLGAWILVGHGQTAVNVCCGWCWADEGFCGTHAVFSVAVFY